MERLTLDKAKEKYNTRKIFDILINDKPYTVYNIEEYEHEYGKWNGCPTTWWLDYSEYVEYIDETGDLEEADIRELVPYIDKGVNRICWEVRFKQRNYMKYKWDDWDLRSGGKCEMYANGKLVYSFFSRDMNNALSTAQTMECKLLEHPYNFLNSEEDHGRKIWYYGLPATIRNHSFEPGEIGIVPDYSYMSKSEWWDELKKRKTNITPNDYKKNDDDESEDESFEEDRRFSSWINHGDAFCDGMINWFRD
jgi:hypothetical protein